MDVDFDMARAAVGAMIINLKVVAMLVASTINYGWLARFVDSHHPNVPMVAFCPNARTERQPIIHQGNHLVVVVLLPKDRASPKYEDLQAIGFVENIGHAVVVLEDNNRRILMWVSTMP